MISDGRMYSLFFTAPHTVYHKASVRVRQHLRPQTVNALARENNS